MGTVVQNPPKDRTGRKSLDPQSRVARDGPSAALTSHPSSKAQSRVGRFRRLISAIPPHARAWSQSRVIAATCSVRRIQRCDGGSEVDHREILSPTHAPAIRRGSRHVRTSVRIATNPCSAARYALQEPAHELEILRISSRASGVLPDSPHSDRTSKSSETACLTSSTIFGRSAARGRIRIADSNSARSSSERILVKRQFPGTRAPLNRNGTAAARTARQTSASAESRSTKAAKRSSSSGVRTPGKPYGDLAPDLDAARQALPCV